MSKYGVISGPNTEKYGPEITTYLETFHAVDTFEKNKKIVNFFFFRNLNLGPDLHMFY